MKKIWMGFSRKAKTYIIAGAAAVLLLVIIVSCASSGGGTSATGSGSANLRPATASYQQICQATVGTTYTNSDGNSYTVAAVQAYAYPYGATGWNDPHTFISQDIPANGQPAGGVNTECVATTTASSADHGSQDDIFVTLAPDGSISWDS